ncbi:MAG: hypothetical protein PHR38_06925, partial [Bacteroidales bacterium]|nr:hypothetical protein [Bacteroidales bacterium]
GWITSFLGMITNRKIRNDPRSQDYLIVFHKQFENTASNKNSIGRIHKVRKKYVVEFSIE